MTTRRNSHRHRGGFTLIEILVATLLLAGSLTAIVKLWSVSRSITERSRNTAEFYAVARQEVERYRPLQYDGIFNSPTFATSLPVTKTADYDEQGRLSTETGFTTAYYRATSKFSVVTTGSETTVQRLGVQEITVTALTTSDPPYKTTEFFTVAGI